VKTFGELVLVLIVKRKEEKEGNHLDTTYTTKLVLAGMAELQ
jgi:hypothetical protein